jgi:hypothetical protein
MAPLKPVFRGLSTIRNPHFLKVSDAPITAIDFGLKM